MSAGPLLCLCVQEWTGRVGYGERSTIRLDKVGRWPTVIFLPVSIESLDSRGEDRHHEDGAVFRVPKEAVMRVPKGVVLRVPSYRATERLVPYERGPEDRMGLKFRVQRFAVPVVSWHPM